jgi:hypothetical protein
MPRDAPVDIATQAADQFRRQQEAYLARSAKLSEDEPVDDYDRTRIGGSIQARISFQIDRRSVIAELIALRNAAANAVVAMERKDLEEVERRVLARNAFRAGCDTVINIRKAAGEKF